MSDEPNGGNTSAVTAFLDETRDSVQRHGTSVNPITRLFMVFSRDGIKADTIKGVAHIYSRAVIEYERHSVSLRLKQAKTESFIAHKERTEALNIRLNEMAAKLNDTLFTMWSNQTARANASFAEAIKQHTTMLDAGLINQTQYDKAVSDVESGLAMILEANKDQFKIFMERQKKMVKEAVEELMENAAP